MLAPLADLPTRLPAAATARRVTRAWLVDGVSILRNLRARNAYALFDTHGSE